MDMYRWIMSIFDAAPEGRSEVTFDNGVATIRRVEAGLPSAREGKYLYRWRVDRRGIRHAKFIGLNKRYQQTQGGDYPFYTHEKIITAAFDGKLNDRQINQIIKGSVYADSKRFQDEEHSYMHAMRSRTQTATQAEEEMWNFVSQQAQRFQTSYLNDDSDQAFF
jgi:hypothetical protein